MIRDACCDVIVSRSIQHYNVLLMQL